MAKIIATVGGEQALLLDVRQSLIYPFVSPSWTDLRLGMWVSVTTDIADNSYTPSVSTEESFTYNNLPDRIYFGLKDSSTAFPFTSGASFSGLTTAKSGNLITVYNPATATSNTWGPTSWYATGNGSNPGYISNSSGLVGANIYDLTENAVSWTAGSSNGIPMPSSTSSGYALYMGIKYTRSSGASSGTIGSASWAISTNSVFSAFYTTAGVFTITGTTPVYTNTPDITSLRNNMRTIPYGAAISSAVISNPTYSYNNPVYPNSIFVHWPFYYTRLRIHALVLEKYAP